MELVTSEAVMPGHPDKLADQISDAILDLYLSVSPVARTAIETMVTANNIIVAGEVGGANVSHLRVEEVIRKVTKHNGYEDSNFHWKHSKITNLLHQQSSDIAQGVDAEGAGDQGIMIGYATNETEEYIPATLYYCRKLIQALQGITKTHSLGPDGKVQITLRHSPYTGMPDRVASIVVSIQHPDSLSVDELRILLEPVVKKIFPDKWLDGTNLYVNPTGRFVIGGPNADTGLTGRKLAVDNYGPTVPHGGGAFSGKDPTKVDRSAAYMARYLAKNIVESGFAPTCLIALSYAIGLKEPLAFQIDTKGVNSHNIEKLKHLLLSKVSLAPRSIITQLDLAKPIYMETAANGHFGYHHYPWEKLDLSNLIRSEFKIDEDNIYDLNKA